MNWTSKIEFFVIGKPFRSSVIEHSSLLGRFVSDEENVVLSIRSLGANSQKLLKSKNLQSEKLKIFAIHQTFLSFCSAKINWNSKQI
jgi:hypothetical protein